MTSHHLAALHVRENEADMPLCSFPLWGFMNMIFVNYSLA